jgi:hypothetical protein
MCKAIIKPTWDDSKVHQSIIRQVSNLLDYFNGDIQVRMVCHAARL